jgi:hypothetical protein
MSSRCHEQIRKMLQILDSENQIIDKTQKHCRELTSRNFPPASEWEGLDLAWKISQNTHHHSRRKDACVSTAAAKVWSVIQVRTGVETSHDQASEPPIGSLSRDGTLSLPIVTTPNPLTFAISSLPKPKSNWVHLRLSYQS